MYTRLWLQVWCWWRTEHPALPINIKVSVNLQLLPNRNADMWPREAETIPSILEELPYCPFKTECLGSFTCSQSDNRNSSSVHWEIGYAHCVHRILRLFSHVEVAFRFPHIPKYTSTMWMLIKMFLDMPILTDSYTAFISKGISDIICLCGIQLTWTM